MNWPIFVFASLSLQCSLADEDSGKSIVEIVQRRGYKVEEHTVETEDGYIITQHRIINETSGSGCGPPVVFGVPLNGDSTIFVIQKPENSMGYYLADRGFDVWLQNVRGNTFGRKHKKVSENDETFWNFTIIEHTDDLRAQLDQTLKITGYKQVHYMGISQGSVIAMTLLSMRPEYNERFGMLALFGAFRTLKHSGGTIQSTTFRHLDKLIKLATLDNSKPTGKLTVNGSRLSKLCQNGGSACGYIIDSLNLGCFDKERIPVLLEHYPAGTSLKNLVYYLQLAEKDAPKLFDYGSRENKRRYNDEHPPSLDPKLITAPIGLYLSDADSLTPRAEFNDLMRDLNHTVKFSYEIKNERTYTHQCYVINATNYALYENFTEEFKRIPLNKETIET